METVSTKVQLQVAGLNLIIQVMRQIYVFTFDLEKISVVDSAGWLERAAAHCVYTYVAFTLKACCTKL